jgi:hypothetical protein
MSETKFTVGDRVRVTNTKSLLFSDHCVIKEIVRASNELSLFVWQESGLSSDWLKEVDMELAEPAPAVNECLTVDSVNHPAHYNQGGIECIEAIKAAIGDGFVSYLRGNCIKYLWRCEHKGGIEDLKKAAFYLDRAIKEMEVSGE